MDKLTEEEIKVFESCKTLPPEFAEATDFSAEEAIKIDYSIELPESYSLVNGFIKLLIKVDFEDVLLCELLIEYKS